MKLFQLFLLYLSAGVIFGMMDVMYVDLMEKHKIPIRVKYRPLRFFVFLTAWPTVLPVWISNRLQHIIKLYQITKEGKKSL